MTGILKANNPSGNAILFFYALCVKLPMLLYTHQPQLQPTDGFLYKGFLQLLAVPGDSFPAIYSIVCFALIFLQAIGFNRIVNAQRLHRQPNYLTGMTYLLVTSLFPDWFSLSAPLLVNSFMIWTWGRLCALYNHPNPKTAIFNIGLATGVSAFIYFPSVAFLLLIMTGILIARPPRMQEWLTGLAGIITPVYFFASYLFLTDQIYTISLPHLRLSYPHAGGNRVVYTCIGAIIAAALFGIYQVNNNMRRQVVQTRKSWQLLFLYGIVSLFIPFLNAGLGFTSWVLVMVPVSPIIAAAFFYPEKRIIPGLLHWGLVALFVYVWFFK